MSWFPNTLSKSFLSDPPIFAWLSLFSYRVLSSLFFSLLSSLFSLSLSLLLRHTRKRAPASHPQQEASRWQCSRVVLPALLRRSLSSIKGPAPFTAHSISTRSLLARGAASSSLFSLFSLFFLLSRDSLLGHFPLKTLGLRGFLFECVVFYTAKNTGARRLCSLPFF